MIRALSTRKRLNHPARDGETPGPRSHSAIASNTGQTEEPSGPATEGNFLFVSLIAGNLAAHVGCLFALKLYWW